MRCRRSDTGLGFVLLSSTRMCCHPTELMILGFFFFLLHKLSNFTPPPPSQARRWRCNAAWPGPPEIARQWSNPSAAACTVWALYRDCPDTLVRGLCRAFFSHFIPPGVMAWTVSYFSFLVYNPSYTPIPLTTQPASFVSTGRTAWPYGTRFNSRSSHRRWGGRGELDNLWKKTTKCVLVSLFLIQYIYIYFFQKKKPKSMVRTISEYGGLIVLCLGVILCG